MSRRRNHSEGCVKLYADGPGVRRVVQFVTSARAQRMLVEERAIAVYDGERFLGIQLCVSKQAGRAKVAMQGAKVTQDPMRSCVILSAAEVEAIAFRTKSRTEGLTEAQRDSRVLRGFPEMDLAERARAKFHQLFGQMATA